MLEIFSELSDWERRIEAIIITDIQQSRRCGL